MGEYLPRSREEREGRQKQKGFCFNSRPTCFFFATFAPSRFQGFDSGLSGSGPPEKLYNDSISARHFLLNQTDQLFKNAIRIIEGQKYALLACSFSILFYFALDWGFSSGTGVKKAARNENDSCICILVFYFRFNLTNTTCCGYNYLVPQNSVASRFGKKPSAI